MKPRTNITSAARGVGNIVTQPGPKPHAPKPKPPKRPPKVAQPTTHTTTLTGTGVNTTSGTGMPGVSSPSGMPDVYTAPAAIKNWGKATAAQIAQAQLAPQYASLYQQKHQSQLAGTEQANVIRTYGTDLAKILGANQASGGALGADFAGALTMASLRSFAYNQFLESAKYADEYAKIAAQYPTLVTQELARRADLHLRQQAFQLQALTAQRAYGIDTAKLGLYAQNQKAQQTLSQGRLQVSQGNLKLAAARYGLSVQNYKLQTNKAAKEWKKWNVEHTDKQLTVNTSLSKAYGYPVNNQGQKIPGAPKIPGGPSGAGGGGANPIDRYASKQVGHWVYKDLSRVPLKVTRKKGLPDKPSQTTTGNPGLRGLSQTQYRSAYGKATGAAIDARDNGGTYQQYIEWAVGESVPRWVAKKAWDKYHKKGK